VFRQSVLDVNVGLIVGGAAAFVVDTLSTHAQAAELLAAVRRVTSLPLQAANTHHHFDHCFGNAVFTAQGVPIWGQQEAAALLRTRGDLLRAQWCDEWAATEPDLVAAMSTVTVYPPDHIVHQESTVDLGGRAVELRHFGRGHSAGDLVVLVPDAGAVFAGDLIEESGPPQFDDAYPLDWPDTLAGLLQRLGEASPVIPGHGDVVDKAFVREQHERLAALDWLIRDGNADGAPMQRVAAKAPFDLDTALVAVRRGYDHLTGKA
jgi:glyoxylase-like metal-dependent hydrolase (beta-lactamase superfamily II)